jgi:DNA polymerase-3 subunit alpha
MGIDILPPDINESEREFRVIGNSIRFGLEAVKGAGTAAIESIIGARQEQVFQSFDDFLTRVDSRKVNKKVVEKLIKAGAFDSIIETRKSAMEMLTAKGRNGATSLFGQQTMFGGEDLPGGTAEWEEHELLSNEKEALGFYITGHPLNKFRSYLESLMTVRTSVLHQPEKIKAMDEVITAGIINSIRKSQTKSKQETMATFVLEDEEGYIDVIVFPDAYRKFSHILVKDVSVLVKGNLEISEKGSKIHAKEILPLDGAFDSGSVKIELRISSERPKTALLEVKKIAENHTGKCPLYVKLSVDDCEALIATRMGLSIDRDVIASFENILGKNSVRIDCHEIVS